MPADRNTGRPRGFAFIEFTEPEAVPKAIEEFNDLEFKGRNLRVKEAEDRPRRTPRIFSDDQGGGGGGFRGGGGGGGGEKRAKPKGSRRNVRGRKRSL